MSFSVKIWWVIGLLAVGTFLIRFSFLGFLGHHPLPLWLKRLLRYTPVAVLPGLVAPHVVWPAATEGVLDPARTLAAIATVATGLITRNLFISIAVGAVTLATALYCIG